MKMKQKYNIGKVLSLAALMALATACHKAPDQPTDNNGHKKIVILWDWYYDGLAPNRDTVKYYADRADVDSIIMMPDSTSYLSNRTAALLSSWIYHHARDTLQERINIAPHKIHGGGKILVNATNGAQLPYWDLDHAEEGMALVDSIWFTKNGWFVGRDTLYKKR